MSRSSIALSNLRAVVIVIVLAFHSVLAYLASLRRTRTASMMPLTFAGHPHRRQPSVFAFDLFCAWQDVSLMSLMFFLSGLFVPSSRGAREASRSCRPFLPDRAAARPGGRVPDAGDVLSDLSRHRRRSERRRLLATPDGTAAVLAVRAAVVLVAAPDAQRDSSRSASRAPDGACGWRVCGDGARPSDPVLVALVALSALAYVPWL